MADWSAVLAGAVSGSFAGGLASLVAPWVNWGIEKRRTKLDTRRKLISEWRDAVAASSDVRAFRDSPSYSAMRPYLLRALIEQIESDTVRIQSGGRGAGVNNIKPALFDDISRIERHWELL